MAENLGSASVDIVVNLGPMGPALDRARQIVATSMNEMRETVESASTAISTALETWGVIKLAEWGRELLQVGLSAVESGAKMEETATAVGLSAEQYQIFSFAARQAGVDQDKFSQAMIFFSRNIGLIEQGAVTPAAKAFRDLGAEIRKNADGTVNYGATLTDFLTKLGRVSDSTRATADSMEAFGRGGGRMILVAKDIANNGFDAVAEKARAMGLVLSNETVAQSKQLEDQFKTLGTVVENDVIRGMVAAAPEIQKVVDKIIGLSGAVSRFISLTPNFDSLTKEQIALYESGLAPALEAATTKLDELQKQQQRYSQQGLVPPRGLTDDLSKQLDLVQELGTKLTAAQQAMQRIMHPDTGTAGTVGTPVADPAQAKLQEEFQRAFDKMNLSINQQTDAYGRLLLAQGKGTDAIREAETANAQEAEVERIQAEFVDKNIKLSAQQIQQIRGEVAARQSLKYAVEDQTKALAANKKSVDEEMAAYEKAIGQDNELTDKERQIADSLGLIERALVEGNITWAQYTQAVAGLKLELDSANKKAQETANKMGDEVSSAVARGASSFLNLASGAQKSTSFMQQMGQAGLGLAQDLLKVVEQLFVLNPLINELKSALGSNSTPLPTGDLGGIEAGLKKFLGFGDSSNGATAAGTGAAAPAAANPFNDPAVTGAAATSPVNSTAAMPGLESMMGNMFESLGKDIMGGGGALMTGAEDLFGNIFSGLGSLISGAGGELSGLFSGIGGLFGFAGGGAFDVSGAGGVDSQLVQFKATPGEHVSVGQDKGPSGGAPNVIINNNHSKVGDNDITAEVAPNGRGMMITIAEAMAHDMRTGGPTGRAAKETFGLSRTPIQR